MRHRAPNCDDSILSEPSQQRRAVECLKPPHIVVRTLPEMRFAFVQNQQLLRCDLVTSCGPFPEVALGEEPVGEALGDDTTEILATTPELLSDCNYRHSAGRILES